MAGKYPVYVVSGGVGHSGEQIVRTVLAQFPEQDIDLRIVNRVRRFDELEEVVTQAAGDGGVVVHTMVNTELRQALAAQLEKKMVPAIDLLGEMLDQFSQTFGQLPSGIPGLYRQQHHSYFERVEAIDYSLEHDDGIDPEGWPEADVLLIGPSRTGKTPISMYLAVLGWKVANYPMVPEIEFPEEIEEVPAHKVIGLTIDPVRLQAHRSQRQKRLGTAVGSSPYTDLEKIYGELDQAEKFYQLRGYRKVDVTDKPIEACADEVLRSVPGKE